MMKEITVLTFARRVSSYFLLSQQESGMWGRMVRSSDAVCDHHILTAIKTIITDLT